MSQDENPVQAFSEAAKAAERDWGAISFATTKYSVLFRHKADQPAEKEALTAALANLGLAVFNKVAAPSFGSNILGKTPILEDLCAVLSRPESLQFIAPDAPAAFADASLSLATKGATLEWNVISDDRPVNANNYESEYRGELLKMTRLAASMADKCKEALEGRTIKIQTSQPVTASKPLQLKTGITPA